MIIHGIIHTLLSLITLAMLSIDATIALIAPAPVNYVGTHLALPDVCWGGQSATYQQT